MSAMRLVLLGGLLVFTAAAGGLVLSLSPGAALGVLAGSGPAATLVVILTSRSKRPDDAYSEPPGALPVFA